MLLVVGLVGRGLFDGALVVREARVGLGVAGARVARLLAARARARAHAREVLRGQNGGQDRALQLAPRVELLEAVDRLLPVHHTRDALAVLYTAHTKRMQNFLCKNTSVSVQH